MPDTALPNTLQPNSPRARLKSGGKIQTGSATAEPDPAGPISARASSARPRRQSTCNEKGFHPRGLRWGGVRKRARPIGTKRPVASRGPQATDEERFGASRTLLLAEASRWRNYGHPQNEFQ